MRHLVLALLPVALSLASCGEASRGRVCEPVRQTGCSNGRTCTVEEDGVPLCLTPGPAVEGDVCDDAATCGEGLGCVRVAGVARCQRFCLPSEDPDFLPCLDGLLPPGDQPASQAARCVAAVIDRPDIGVCVLPCRPGVPEDCPASLACQPSLIAGMATCVTPGPAGPGDACGPDVACAQGLACVAEGQALTCRPFEPAAGCPIGQAARAVAGVQEAIEGAEIRVCVPN